jgi:hypothetical protein
VTVVEDLGFSAESLRELEVVFSAVAGWATRIKIAPPPPEAGSMLAADDAALASFEVSHAVQGVLLSAVDHIDALRALVVDAKMVHSRAPFTLLRAALENAATAVWLLAPDVQSE